MRLTKALGAAGALIVAALVGGTLIGSTLATDEADATDTTSRGEYCDTFRDALASELGVTADELLAAGKAAATATIDAAVAAGDLSEERAGDLRDRVAEGDTDECMGLGGAFGGGFGIGFERGAIRGFLGGDLFEAAADALGMDSSALLGELHDAGSLEALAEAQGADYETVKAAILAAVQADLDAAVDEGLDPDRAEAVIERLTTWLDDGGEVDDGPGLLGLGGRPHFHGGPFGPWGHDDAEEDDAEDTGT
ncbi:MAG TPA: hypothetical protein VFP30_08865 [Candidatus Limnocylindria bacterium]|nr:hypothetical protein [Candidatus Limnocylindria bacterium]